MKNQIITKGGNMEDIFTWIKEFNDKYFPNWRETPDIYLSNAIAGETGELCNAVKHYYGGGSKGMIVKDKEEIYIECADILIYVSLFLMKNGVDNNRFKEIIYNKIEENKKKVEKRKSRYNIDLVKKNIDESNKLRLLEKNSKKY